MHFQACYDILAYTVFLGVFRSGFFVVFNYHIPSGIVD